MADNENLAIWNRRQATHPKYTKNFSRGGGFKGTAINPTYLIKCATEEWGPVGKGWGWHVLDDKLDVFGDTVVHATRVGIWWMDKDGANKGPEQWGATTYQGKNKNGTFVDEEARKKSLTDALVKCLSMMGFSADVHLGMWDDGKYVASRVEEAKSSEPPAKQPTSEEYALAISKSQGIPQLKGIGKDIHAAKKSGAIDEDTAAQLRELYENKMADLGKAE